MKLPGINTLRLTRALSHEQVDKKTINRQIVEILEASKEPMTAREISEEMYRRGYSSSWERQLSAPRITELLRDGILDVAGEKTCEYSKRVVGTFKLREGVKLDG